MCCVKDLSVAFGLLARGPPGSREWHGSIGDPAEVLKGTGFGQDLLLYLLSWRCVFFSFFVCLFFLGCGNAGRKGVTRLEKTDLIWVFSLL